MIAIAKARVLPEPVGARPETSRPASASGSVAAWIGNGVVMPSRANERDDVGGHAKIGEGVWQEDSSQL